MIFEIYPFKYFFENGFRFEKQNFDKLTSYFETGANHYAEGLDYFGHVKYESKEGFWFMHMRDRSWKNCWRMRLQKI